MTTGKGARRRLAAAAASGRGQVRQAKIGEQGTPDETPEDASPRIASLARRLAALFYEVLLLLPMIIVAGFAFLPFASRAAVATKTLETPSPLARTVMFSLLVAGSAVFYGWCWSGGRRTLAQKTWRLRLVDRRGALLTPPRALVRYVAFWIGPAIALGGYALLQQSGHARNALAFFALNYCWAIVDPDRQFLHDRIAGSVIVQDTQDKR
ncbi:MAG TPA: RDD family protein [Casimicrobiaceae bacterium]|nr:RDD family protein [Casimicrobiaceae bacterium]